jgi:hypothetical protein
LDRGSTCSRGPDSLHHLPLVISSLTRCRRRPGPTNNIVARVRLALQTCSTHCRPVKALMGISPGRTRALQAAVRRGQPYRVKTMAQGWGKASTAQLCYSPRYSSLTIDRAITVLEHYARCYHPARCSSQVAPLVPYHVILKTMSSPRSDLDTICFAFNPLVKRCF